MLWGGRWEGGSCLGTHVRIKDFKIKKIKNIIRKKKIKGLPLWLSGKESACSVGDVGGIHELGRSPGGGHGNPLQYSYLENPCGQRSLAS